MGSKIYTKQKIESQLGMSEGRANSRLRRQIIFMLVQKAGMDTCFVCGDRIVDPFDCTIEHKEPWLDVHAELFWDLDNIAFSHTRCNLPHRYHGKPRVGLR